MVLFDLLYVISCDLTHSLHHFLSLLPPSAKLHSPQSTFSHIPLITFLHRIRDHRIPLFRLATEYRSDTATYPVTCPFPFFVALFDHNPPTLQSDRQTDFMLVRCAKSDKLCQQLPRMQRHVPTTSPTLTAPMQLGYDQWPLETSMTLTNCLSWCAQVMTLSCKRLC